MSILNEIISNINNNEETKTPTIKVNPSKFLNNLDDCDEQIGTFNIKIFGIGGAGCNVVNTIFNFKKWPSNVEIFALNTDIKTLRRLANISNVYLLGKKILRGAGSGGDPEIARTVVQEDTQAIKEILKGTDLLFIIAGLGKGTGSGASPEIAKIAKELGILTVAIVNFPSINSEGSSVYKNALEHFETLKKQVDSITYISNDRIIKNNKETISFMDAYAKANNEVTNIISHITGLITSASEINIDYSDIKNFFKHNKNFFANTISIQSDYSRENLKQILQHSLFESNSDINTDMEHANVLANFTISPKTPATIVSDTRNAFKELINNQNLTMVSGIDYQGTGEVSIMYLMSSGQQQTNLKEIDSYENVNEFKKNNHQYLNDLLSNQKNINLNEYQTIHEGTSIGIERQSIIDDIDEDEIASDELNSQKAIELITKAMNNVINPIVKESNKN
jgi:cell division protein FtsZ